MKRLLVGACALALMGVGVGSAIGQGTGGTVGSAATGTKTFDLKFGGFGCGLTPLRKCRAKPGVVFAGNGTVSVDGKKIGGVVFSNVAAKRVGKRGSIDTFTGTIYHSNGEDTLTGAGVARDPGKAFPYAVVGGTGIYAGARGTARDAGGTENTLKVEVTFIP